MYALYAIKDLIVINTPNTIFQLDSRNKANAVIVHPRLSLRFFAMLKIIDNISNTTIAVTIIDEYVRYTVKSPPFSAFKMLILLFLLYPIYILH